MHMHKDQKTPCKVGSILPQWVPRIELRLSGLEANASYPWRLMESAVCTSADQALQNIFTLLNWISVSLNSTAFPPVPNLLAPDNHYCISCFYDCDYTPLKGIIQDLTLCNCLILLSTVSSGFIYIIIYDRLFLILKAAWYFTVYIHNM